jgi:hypothetical protein
MRHSPALRYEIAENRKVAHPTRFERVTFAFGAQCPVKTVPATPTCAAVNRAKACQALVVRPDEEPPASRTGIVTA